jgi:hypothetical protein
MTMPLRIRRLPVATATAVIIKPAETMAKKTGDTF